MQKIVKVCLSVFLILAFFSCDQHYFYLKKVKANSSTSKIEDRSKQSQLLANIEHQKSFSHQRSDSLADENIVASKNSSNFEMKDLSVDTPKPFIIKKTPVIVDENIQEKEKKESNDSSSDKEEKKFPAKIMIGLILMILGGVGFYLSILYINNSQRSSYYSTGCSELFTGLLLGLISALLTISGVILTIIGLID